MPKQLDQLPPDATALARRLARLESEVKELRAARRMGSATVGTLKIYAADGQTLLAQLGPTADGGGGLQTYGHLGVSGEIPVIGSLSSGELNFRPAVDHVADVPARLSYDTIPETGQDIQLSSGSIKETDWAAILDLGSVAGGVPTVSVSGFREVDGTGEAGPCNLDIDGVLTSTNIAYGQVTITPSAANTPTSALVSGLGLRGSTFYGWATAQSVVPGSQVTGVGITGISSTGCTVWATRTNTTATVVNWLVIGV